MRNAYLESISMLRVHKEFKQTYRIMYPLSDFQEAIFREKLVYIFIDVGRELVQEKGRPMFSSWFKDIFEQYKDQSGIDK